MICKQCGASFSPRTVVQINRLEPGSIVRMVG
nr:MAG TPA: C2H2 type zinc-finger protein [Bacteriophage sp.]